MTNEWCEMHTELAHKLGVLFIELAKKKIGTKGRVNEISWNGG